MCRISRVRTLDMYVYTTGYGERYFQPVLEVSVIRRSGLYATTLHKYHFPLVTLLHRLQSITQY